MSFLKQVLSLFSSKKEIIIVPYRGYANKDKLFLKGRVLKNKGISPDPANSTLSNLLNTYKRFETDEVGCIQVKVKINNQYFERTTDSEGYFMIDERWTAPPTQQDDQWIDTKVQINEALPSDTLTETGLGEVIFTKGNSNYGVISDIDDTILQSHVTSRLKWRLFYVTMFKSAFERRPMTGVTRLFRAMAKGSDGRQANPIFYVSNSPWNIYDLIVRFLEIQHLPKGPVLLRDYGIKPAGHFRDHKAESIRHILRTYPHLEFILLGDSGEKDADIYIRMVAEFPTQIKAIYIRKVKADKNARRVAKLIKQHPEVNALLAESSDDMIAHAQQHGFILSY
ncbi:MAG: DUF2183 domain-containing protein [Bacteroidia bacterium]|nr:DUF2183 domain-containing protein [Bacteroidia bacterium]